MGFSIFEHRNFNFAPLPFLCSSLLCCACWLCNSWIGAQRSLRLSDSCGKNKRKSSLQLWKHYSSSLFFFFQKLNACTTFTMQTQMSLKIFQYIYFLLQLMVKNFRIRGQHCIQHDCNKMLQLSDFPLGRGRSDLAYGKEMGKVWKRKSTDRTVWPRWPRAPPQENQLHKQEIHAYTLPSTLLNHNYTLWRADTKQFTKLMNKKFKTVWVHPDLKMYFLLHIWGVRINYFNIFCNVDDINSYLGASK